MKDFQMLRVSVITPSFNQGEFIEETIESVLSQGYPNLEYIIIDGGSTDATLDVIDKYRDQIDIVISEPDDGQTDAIMKGFSLATGDILAWLNSDDIYEPDALLRMARVFEQNPEVEWCYGDASWIDRNGRILRPKKEMPFIPFVWLRDFNYLPQPSTFWRRSLYERVGGLNPSFDLAMDADLWDRFFTVDSPLYIQQKWSRMREYPEQKNQALRGKSDIEDNIIRSRHGIKTEGLVWRASRVIAKVIRIFVKVRYGSYRH